MGMNRNKFLYLLTLLAVLGVMLGFTILSEYRDVPRYHQHLEQPSEAELGPYTDTSDFVTHLPILQIDTGGQMIPGAAILDQDDVQVGYETTPEGADEILVRLSVTDTPNQYHRLSDTPTLESEARFRIRGNTSRLFPKANYRIKLVDEKDSTQDIDLPLLGMDSGNEWSLHGPYLDKTLMRNYLCMNLSAEIMGDAPDVRFCEVFVNGEYRGVYLLMETITEGPGRVELTEYEEGDPLFSYMFRIEAQKSFLPTGSNVLDNFSYYTLRLEDNARVEVLYPTTRYQTPEVLDYINTDLSEIERRLYSREMDQNPESCWEYLDMESFANYYILQEFFGINDMFSASTYFYKDVRGKLHIGPVWDYNNAFNNYIIQMPENEFLLSQKGWYSQLMRSEHFVEYVIARYHALRQHFLSDEYLTNYVTDVKTWLGSAVDRNFSVWGYTFDVTKLSVWERQRPGTDRDSSMEELRELNPSSYDEAIEMMLDYAVDRGAWMDEAVESLRQYCHPSKNAYSMYD